MNTTIQNNIYNDPDIEPIAQLYDLCELLRSFHPTIHYPSEPEYEYLEEGCACITVQNPFSDDKMFIDLAGEFTLTCINNHTHYFSCQSGYESLKRDVVAILQNRLCSASLYSTKSGRHWLGSVYISKNGIRNQSIRDIFEFVLKYSEFRKEVVEYGGVCEYRFWNPSDNRDIIIAPHDPMMLCGE